MDAEIYTRNRLETMGTQGMKYLERILIYKIEEFTFGVG
jgi:hypothetical protein